MSKRNATGSSRSRKKRKAAGYASVDLDLPDEHPGNVEIVRVWDVGTSKTTGRVSATRKTHRHVNDGWSEPTREEPALTVEDVNVPVDPEPSKQPPIKPVAKRKRVVKAIKENDSVSRSPRSSSKPDVHALTDEDGGLAPVPVDHFGRITSRGWFG